MKVLFALLLCGLVALSRIFAQEAAPEIKGNSTLPFIVTAESRIVVLPQKEAVLLLPELADDARCEAGYERLQAMIQDGKAELVADLVLKTREGKTATAAASEEMRYPTEFDPPTPTAFETRDLGPSLELTPISLSADGRSVEVNVTARDVRFLHWNRYDAGGLPNGERLGIEQPQFHSIRNTSTLRLQNGQRILFGAHKIPGDKGGMELFLLRVSAVKSP